MKFPSGKYNILVVCAANVTRSAYLRGYLKSYIKSSFPGIKNKVRIYSAGVEAINGMEADQVIQRFAKSTGFSLGRHRSSLLTQRLVDKADVILTMEKVQKDMIIRRFRYAEDKTFRVMEYVWREDPRRIIDIFDPTGLGIPDYREFVNLVHSQSDRIVKRVSTQLVAS